MIKINLKNKISSTRNTRVIIGLSPSTDISILFENNEKDFIDNQVITHENFDIDNIFFIQGFGYVKRQSLLNSGFIYVILESLYDSITIGNLK